MAGGSTIVVTQTSIYTSDSKPTGLSNDNNNKNKDSGGGLSHTNQIVVGVVVGVGGALLIGIAALVFFIKKNKTSNRESGWTFWRKNEKGGEDNFFDGELGVRDRNINQGSNF